MSRLRYLVVKVDLTKIPTAVTETGELETCANLTRKTQKYGVLDYKMDRVVIVVNDSETAGKIAEALELDACLI